MTERLFLALWPPAQVLSELVQALPQHLRELRWQPGQRMHITLGFLGERSHDKELRRFERLEVAVADSLRLQGSGTFGPVLWTGVSCGPWLAGLAGCCARHFDIADRRFRAHLTLARSRSGEGRQQLSQARRDLADFRSSRWLPGELTLVRSRTGPQPSYEVIGRKPFAST